MYLDEMNLGYPGSRYPSYTGVGYCRYPGRVPPNRIVPGGGPLGMDHLVGVEMDYLEVQTIQDFQDLLKVKTLLDHKDLLYLKSYVILPGHRDLDDLLNMVQAIQTYGHILFRTVSCWHESVCGAITDCSASYKL